MCVGGDTKILTNPKGAVAAKTIFETAKKTGNAEEVGKKNIEVITLKKPVKTFSITKAGEIVTGNITHTTRLRAPAYHISLSDGNTILSSCNQPFLVYHDGELTWKRLEDLKEGDAVAKINSANVKKASWNIPFSHPDLQKRNGRHTLKSRNLSRSNWISLPKKTTPDLMEICGLVMSDGHIDKRKESVTFANNDDVLRVRFKHLLNRVFGIDSVTEYHDGRVVAYSRLLAEFLIILGIDAGKKEGRILPFMYKLPDQEIKAFIRGYFDGDGCAAMTPYTTKQGKKGAYPTPIIYCKSRAFLQQMQSLLQLRLGIATRLLEHKTKKGLMQKLVIRGFEGRKKFLAIGSSCSKLEKLKNIELNDKQKEYENIPTPTRLVNKLKNKLPYSCFRNNDYYVYGKGRFTRYTLQKLFSLGQKHGIVDGALKKEFDLLNRRDIGWETITGISFAGEQELYDFTVDKDSFTTENLLLLHNSKYYGQSEENLRKKFEEAEKNAPSIIFIDEIDAIAIKREESRGEVERRVVAQLLALMDGLKSRGKVVVIAATNIPNSLDSALRRPGRFDREIEIGVPHKEGRLNILKIHTRNMPLSKDVKLEDIAEITYGFVGADLSALAKEAAMIVLRRVLPELHLSEQEPIPREILEKLQILQGDFMEALKVVRPSAMREVLVEIPTAKWNDIGGLGNVKQELMEAVEWPLKYGPAFKRLGIKPPKGVLLYGPPGTGKTLLAKAVANESKANFILVKGPELLSMWVGESERGIRKIFQRARQTSPTIIFFDEMDAIAPRRGLSADSHVTERVVNQLLTEMDGLEEMHDVVIIGATNRPDILDTALLRPGRFDRIILTPVPDAETRKTIFEVHTKKMPLKNVDLDELARLTEDFVGADIEAVCKEAGIQALRKNIKAKEVTMDDFREALKMVHPSSSKDIQKTYEEMEGQFRTAKAKELQKQKPSYFG
ncbi:AAA family ATPase [Candidatus Woesearchaeota archaeon]|nr:AAA family ATPase [Candidatus Woesearchaeota archaeon]